MQSTKKHSDVFTGKQLFGAIDSTRYLAKLQGAIKTGAFISCFSANKDLTTKHYQDVQLLHRHVYSLLTTSIVYGTR